MPLHCNYFQQSRCQSCRWLPKPYTRQLADKQAHLQQKLSSFAVAHWHSPVASPTSAFRNKAKMVVLGAAHAPLLGIISPDGTPTSLTECTLYPTDMQSLLKRLERWIQQAGIPPYRIDKAKGELKFILLTRNQHGEYLLRFVLRSQKSLARIEANLPLLLQDYPNILVISVNIQPTHMAILEGAEEIFLSNQTILAENINGIPLFIRPKSFFQTNTNMAGQLYQTAKAWSQLIAPNTILDLFCGVGGFGLHCATKKTTLMGIEMEEEAITCAQRSAQLMGLTQANFQALDAALYHLSPVPDLVIVNPPRRGLGEVLCQQLGTLLPRHILYSSCHIDSLVRDLNQLPAYQIKQVQLFDMFPHTAHYEVLVQLDLKGVYKNPS